MPASPRHVNLKRFAQKFFIHAFLVPCVLTIPDRILAESITVAENPTRWTLHTNNSSYQIILTGDNNLSPGFFGPISGNRLYEPAEGRVLREEGTVLREIPYRGGYAEMTPILEVIFADNTRELELEYTNYEISMSDGSPCLRLDMTDSHYPFCVSEFIRVIPELDMYEKWLELKNTGKENILIETAYSGSLLLPGNSYDVMHLSGDWGREFFPRWSQLTSGVKSIFNRGIKSQEHAPFFMIRPAGERDEDTGPVWFGAVSWSGNWRLDFEVNRMERTQVSGGINFWDTHWILEGNGGFTTPKFVYGFANDGNGGASRRLHRYIMENVLPKSFNRQPGKVLYNSWYATTFNVNEKDQVALARMANDIGIELFVMDDGWFKGRNDDTAGLGDWTPDPVKFPNGLGPMIRQINDLGMDFGLWVEPEMVNPNSDLYRAHPEWALSTPHRTPHLGRNQLVLNFARDDVKQYTLNWMNDLLSQNNIKFIKWDMNRFVSETGWSDAAPERQRELRIRYTYNLYDIVRTLREEYPEVVFETCSGGGGRTNTGILSLTDQIWTSDNTDPGDRLFIQFGYSQAFPAKTMVNWVTDSEWHEKTTSLKFRFHVAMAGNLGIGNDLHQWDDAEKNLAREMISLYKSVRHIIQLGDQYRLRNPFEEGRAAVQFAAVDGKESVLFVYQLLETLPKAATSSSSSDRLVLRGLNRDAVYTLTGDAEPAEVSGEILMASGLSVPLRGNYSSKIILLKQKY